MLTLVLTATLGASPSLAAPGFTCSGLEPALCDAYLEHFVANLTARGVPVTTRNDMANVLGIERQRQLLGCSDDKGSCLTELAGALGVANLLSGSVSRTESGYLSTLKVIDASSGATKWSATTRVDTEKALFAFFDAEAGTLVSTIAPDAKPVRPGTPAVVKWIPGMVGAALIGVGVGLFSVAGQKAQLLRDQIADPEPLTLMIGGGLTVEDEILEAAEVGRTAQTFGWVSMGVGGAAIVSSFLWWLLTPSSPVAVALVPAPGGGVASFSLRLP
jgi:TolB-like protein